MDKQRQQFWDPSLDKFSQHGKKSNHNFIAETCFSEAGPSIGTCHGCPVPDVFTSQKFGCTSKKCAKNKNNMLSTPFQ